MDARQRDGSGVRQRGEGHEVTSCGTRTKADLLRAVEDVNRAAGRRVVTVSGLINHLVTAHLPGYVAALLREHEAALRERAEDAGHAAGSREAGGEQRAAS